MLSKLKNLIPAIGFWAASMVVLFKSKFAGNSKTAAIATPSASSASGIVATAWGWIAWAGKGLWNSFWDVWGNPVSYPIIGAVAFVMFSLGHHEGHKPVASARADLASARNELAIAKEANARHKTELSLAADKAKAACQAIPAVAPATPVVKPASHKKPVPAAAAVKPVSLWPF